jgi:uncharacterized protein YneF (UPF0154 family)
MHTSSVVLLILTFLLGLFLAAYASRKEMEVVIREQQAELDKLNR